jgi:hypothetical protein
MSNQISYYPESALKPTIIVNGKVCPNPDYSPLLHYLSESKIKPIPARLDPIDHSKEAALNQSFKTVMATHTANTKIKLESQSEKMYRVNQENRAEALNQIARNAIMKLKQQGVLKC